MLLSMQQLATTAPQSQVRNFADLLAGLTLGAKKPPQRDLDRLEDDVATFSYEPALRNRSALPPSPTEVVVPKPDARTTAQEGSAAGPGRPARRSASVTVRFSAPEAELLHAHAAEAGMTVSAYLRSCAFEVESLRAEVKSTMAQLRSAANPEAKPAAHHASPHRPWFRWFRSISSRSAMHPSAS